MKINRSIQLVFLILLLSSFLFAQNQDDTLTEKNLKSEKVEIIGNYTQEHIEAILDVYFQHTQPNLRIYLITYGTERWVAVRDRLIRNLIEKRDLKGLTVEVIKGGFANEVNTEVWLVPQNAEPPKVRETAYKISRFNSFKSSIWKKEFENALKKQAEAENCREQIYVIVYAKSENSLNNIAKKYLDYAISSRYQCQNIHPRPIAIIKGEISKEILTTIWMIPTGSESPVPNKKYETK